MSLKKKIIRACTVSMSIDFVTGMLPDLMKKYEVVILSSPGPEMDEVKKRYGVKTIAVPMERHISLRHDLVSLWRMIQVFRKEKPDMVHSMTPKAGLLCMMAGWLTRVPVRVHTFTGLVFPTSTGLKRRILMLTDSITCWCATHVIPEGEGVKADLRNHGITHKPLKILGYGNVRGVDMERFDPKRFNDNENLLRVESGEWRDSSEVESIKNSSFKTQHSKLQTDSKLYTLRSALPLCTFRSKNSKLKTFRFLFVGRIVRDKGMNELMGAFQRLNEKYPNVRLVLVGSYEDSLDPVSEDTKRIIQDNPNIETPGSKYGDDLIRSYAEADCFVFPSYREGFPNTVLEAGAMGLPSIVTDINGSREIISLTPDPSPKGEGDEKGEGNSELRTKNSQTDSKLYTLHSKLKTCMNGIIIPPRDEEALYAAMERMVTDEEMRKQMAANARPMIAQRFEQGFVRRCLYEFYEEIL